MRKTVNPGQINGHDVFCKIKFEDGDLSISGVVGPYKNGNAWGGCGQIVDELSDITNYSKGWDHNIVECFQMFWKQYHLNYMRAGCVHQRRAGWDNFFIGKSCVVCGYKYGSAWLREEVSLIAIAWFEALPETTIKPNWV